MDFEVLLAAKTEELGSNLAALLYIIKHSDNEEVQELAAQRLANAATGFSVQTRFCDQVVIRQNSTVLGGVVWRSAHLLAQMIPERIKVEGLNVVELGTGTGLVGIWASINGARFVWLTGGDQNVLESTRYNVTDNGCEEKTDVLLLDWGGEIPEEIAQPIDVVLAADVVYEPEQGVLLISALNRLLMRTEQKGQEISVHLVIPLRNRMQDDTQAFADALEHSEYWLTISRELIAEDKMEYCYYVLQSNIP